MQSAPGAKDSRALHHQKGRRCTTVPEPWNLEKAGSGQPCFKLLQLKCGIAYFAGNKLPMKKLFWIVPAAVLLLLVCGFFLLPSQTIISQKMTLRASQDGVVNALTNKEKWQQWWPADQQDLLYDSLNFSYQQQLMKTAILHVPYRDTLLPAQINAILYKIDSSAVIFQTSLPPATNPFARLSNYLQGRKIAGTADEILEHLRAYAVKDTSFVAVRFTASSYPAPDLVYGAVDELRSYIRTSEASERGYPMLHAEHEGNGEYSVMVAIPVDRVLPGNERIKPKRMVPGNILVAEVKGGAFTVQKAMESFHRYVSDHKRQSPAIPFESLVTDRTKEPDTTKWITRLYYPVM
jgi:hypothetical protein